MKVFYTPITESTGHLVAYHKDNQTIEDTAYGPGIKTFTISDDAIIERVGPVPKTGGFDTRPIVIPFQDLASTKASAQKTILALIKEASDNIISYYPQSELLSWGTKQEAARVYLAKGTLTDMQKLLLDSELAAGGGTMDDLCKTIVANAEKFISISGQLAGLRWSTAAEIDAVKELGDLTAIVDKARDKIAAIVTTARAS